MPLGRIFAVLLGLGFLAVAAAGCDPEGSNMAEMLGVGEDTNLLTPAPKRTPKPRPTVVPSPTATPAGPDPRKAYLRRNFNFDSLRSKGMQQVYDRRIDEASGTFNKALNQRPNDKATQLWLETIRKSKEDPKAAGAHSFRSITNGAGTTGQGANPAFQAPAMFPPAGAAAGAPAAQASPFDPRQVF